MVECGFCLELVPSLHKKSHTLPKWMAKYAVNPSGILISKNQTPKISQRSQWGEFICNGCEGLFSRFDTYAANLFGEDAKEFITKNGIVAGRYLFPDTNVFFYNVKGINAKELQNFILSVVVRQNLFLKKQGKELIVVPEQQIVMKEMIQGETFKGDIFPIQIFNTNRDCVAMPPVVVTSDGSIRFMGSGIFIIVHLNAQKVSSIKEMMLNETENFFIERTSNQIGIMDDVKQMIADLPASSRDYVNRKISKI